MTNRGLGVDRSVSGHGHKSREHQRVKMGMQAKNSRTLVRGQ